MCCSIVLSVGSLVEDFISFLLLQSNVLCLVGTGMEVVLMLQAVLLHLQQLWQPRGWRSVMSNLKCGNVSNMPEPEAASSQYCLLSYAAVMHQCTADADALVAGVGQCP